MKKNNKGFFLAETIVIIALVTTVMAFVYPNVSKLYENYKLQVKYYDQPEDIYALKAIYDANESFIDTYTLGQSDGCDTNEKGGKIFSNGSILDVASSIRLDTISYSDIDINILYISGYMSNLSYNDDYNFNRYLKRMKKTTNDKPAYRLIGVFGSGANTRYASIKIENPHGERNCNL